MNVKIITFKFVKILKDMFLFLIYLLVKNKLDKGVLVLTYHRISREKELSDPLKVSVDTFEKQIKYLSKKYNIVSADDIVNALNGNKKALNKLCLITFDDGWHDNYENAFEVLKRYNVPAIIFVATDFIGTNNIFWPEKISLIFEDKRISQHNCIDINHKSIAVLPADIVNDINFLISKNHDELYFRINVLIEKLKDIDIASINNLIHYLEKQLNINKSLYSGLMLSWEEISEMARNNVDFGSHTKSHRLLTNIDSLDIYEEILDSKAAIEKRLKKEVMFISYPNGNHNDFVVSVTKDAGYLAAFTCLPGVNNSNAQLFKLRRKHIREDSSLNWFGKYSNIFFSIDLSGVKEYLKYKVLNY